MEPTYIGIDMAKASFCLAIPQSNGRFLDYTLANIPTGFDQLRALLPPTLTA